MKRYGFDYDSVHAHEPGLVYYSISGFGQTGPLAERPAMDPVLQAFIGIVNENRGEHDNHPHRIAISLIDMFTGLLGFQAIATSLHAQAKAEGEKQGRYLEASLMQGGAMLSVIRMIAQYLERGAATRTSMPNGVFDTADGQLNVTMVRPTDWPPFCEVIERSDLLEDARFASHAARRDNLDELYAEVRPVFKAKSTEWLAKQFTRTQHRELSISIAMKNSPFFARGTGRGHRHYFVARSNRALRNSRCRCRTSPACQRFKTAPNARTTAHGSRRAYAGGFARNTVTPKPRSTR